MKTILLIEDDRFQAADIRDNLIRRCAAEGLAIQFAATIATEESALQFIRSPAMPSIDLFIIDLMLPWCRTMPPTEPADPRVRTEGTMRAGFRIIEALRLSEGNRGIHTKPAILYTVATLVAEGNGHQDMFKYRRAQKTDDAEDGLASLVIELFDTTPPSQMPPGQARSRPELYLVQPSDQVRRR